VADRVPSGVRHMARAIGEAWRFDEPYPHWVLHDALPAALAAGIRALPVAPSLHNASGQRASCNALRQFCSQQAQTAHAEWTELAALVDHPASIRAIDALRGTALGGSSLRIEYCLDMDGFWLEPHTGIGVKRFTMVLNLSDDPGCEAWGTDVLRADGSLVRRMNAVPNSALTFLPAADTWHGFAPRPISGTRQSLIVNDVTNAWRARHELAFPQTPVFTC
jgi:hypothetical protein